ncbi:MAG: glycoside hydrolase family 2 protein [Clostridia bacterium]|nr:glycoside hydrolase family 2 protein [Clostridia bacterium]
MRKQSLNGVWRMRGNGFDLTGKVPGSVYSFLLDAGRMEDPFWRENEVEARALLEHDYTFSRSFSFRKGKERVALCCDGLDTLCRVTLNGAEAATAHNMHRRWRWDVTELLKDGENEIAITFFSPLAYCREEQAKTPLHGMKQAVEGYAHIRKAHCMMGWDWGPILPDAGIWRDVYLAVDDGAVITDCRVTQRHENGRVFLTVTAETAAPCALSATLTDPDGVTSPFPVGREAQVPSPRLWWPNGLGDQPLYTVAVTAKSDGGEDRVEKRIGLRTLRLVKKEDEYGLSFFHEANGTAFFAMGANYIPEDNILSRVTPARSRALLQQAKDAHFNVIRVWGGGYYPDDFFYDVCDEMGIVVFQDLMFGNCTLPRTEEMRREVAEEVRDNLLRIRHHASLGLISGNNEIEANTVKKMDEADRAFYLSVFEDAVPRVVSEVCPEIPYVPSSPSAEGGFVDTSNDDRGDSHYWDVWHKGVAISEYRRRFFRYLSEFGFESLPDERTIGSFTLPEDRDIASPVMDRHQRRITANSRLLGYMVDLYRVPGDFSTLIYASQLLQAYAIRTCAEHLRRHRGRCMGALFWQLDDIWPCPCWSSIDYFGRPKALQYAARRFFEPVHISCEERGEIQAREELVRIVDPGEFETSARLSLQNETKDPVSGTVRWELRSPAGKVLEAGGEDVTVAPFSALWVKDLDLHRTDASRNHLSFRFEAEGEVISEGTALFTAPRRYAFADPALTWERRGDTVTVRAKAYAQGVEIRSPDCDLVLSDNYFDMEPGEKTVRILKGDPVTLRLRSARDIR